MNIEMDIIALGIEGSANKIGVGEYLKLVVW